MALTPTLCGWWEVCQGRPQGSPPFIHPAPALTMTTEERLERLRGHSKGGSGVVGQWGPLRSPWRVSTLLAHGKKCRGEREWMGIVPRRGRGASPFVSPDPPGRCAVP